MNIPPIQSPTTDTSNVPIEDLAGNKNLTQQQKIHEASRQFESIMLQQILSEMQKPVITSEFTDDSTSSDIYQGYITNALAQSMSKSGSFGFAKIFEEQLSPHTSHISKATSGATPAPVENSLFKPVNSPAKSP
jgi:Rod binding domain-containing protein